MTTENDTATEVRITPDHVILFLTQDYEKVPADVRKLVLDTILDDDHDPNLDDDLITDLTESLPVTIRTWQDGYDDDDDDEIADEVDHDSDYETAAKNLYAGIDPRDYGIIIHWEAIDAAGNEIDNGEFTLDETIDATGELNPEEEE